MILASLVDIKKQEVAEDSFGYGSSRADKVLKPFSYVLKRHS